MTRSDDPFAPGIAEQRREARERAIEMLYEAAMRNVPVGEVVEASTIPPDPFAVELAEGVEGAIAELDAQVSELLDRGWTIDRLGALDLWVIRLGLYELGRVDGPPPAVVIDEAVELAKQYGATDDSGRFTNGILAAALERR